MTDLPDIRRSLSIEYDPVTEMGAFVIRVSFERTLSKDAYANRKAFILGLGGTEDEAKEYAGFADAPKPSVAMAYVAKLTNVPLASWQALYDNPIKMRASP